MAPSMAQRTSCLLAENDDDNDESRDNIGRDSLPAELVGWTIMFVAFWPLLAILRATMDSQMISFDIDQYMALTGMLGTPSDGMRIDEIVELPPLSPAEQLLGALFGPPSR